MLDSTFSAFSTFSTTKLQLLLASVPVPTYPVPEAAVSLAVETSDSHVGAVLQQCLGGSWSPLAIFSKKLSSAKSKYFVFNRELLAAYSSVHHFRFFLEASEFTLYTDHKPLTLTLFPSSLPWSARQTHHLAYISIFTSDIVHIPGSKNVVSDTYLTLPAPPCLFSPPFHSISPPPVLIFPLSLPCNLPALSFSQ